MIVPARGTAARPANVVQLAADGVAADVRVLRPAAGSRSVAYSVRIASAHVDVAARLVGVRADGAIDELGGVAVAAGSLGAARIRIGPAGRRPYTSVYLEIRGPRIALRAEAPRPVHARSPVMRAGIWCAGIGAVVASVGLTFVAVSGRGADVRPAVAAPVRAARVTVAHAPPRPAARIVTLSARRAWEGRADVVTVAFLALADAGSVTLIDAAGIPLRSVSLARDGVVRFEVPSAYGRSSVVAKVAVRRGATDALASVALAAVPEAAPSPAPAATQPAPVASGSSLVGMVGDAVAGHPVRVRVGALTHGGRVELQDAAGATIDAADVAPGTAEVQLRLPVAATTAFLVTRYERNGAEETLVRPLAIRAR